MLPRVRKTEFSPKKKSLAGNLSTITAPVLQRKYRGITEFLYCIASAAHLLSALKHAAHVALQLLVPHALRRPQRLKPHSVETYAELVALLQPNPVRRDRAVHRDLPLVVHHVLALAPPANRQVHAVAQRLDAAVAGAASLPVGQTQHVRNLPSAVANGIRDGGSGGRKEVIVERRRRKADAAFGRIIKK